MNDNVPESEALGWDLDERDEALATGELDDDTPAPVEVVVSEDE